MDSLETRVNNYINNELLNFNNIETNPLEGKDLKDSILNRLFSRKWSRKAQFEAAKEYTEEKVDCAVAVIDRIYQAEKDKLSDNAKELYNIRPEENEFTEDQTNTLSM